jgi:hypothetical protein
MWRCTKKSARPDPELRPFQTLQRYWRESNSEVATRVHDESAIVAVEQKYDVKLPEDFREYLLYCCPAGENWDDKLTDWWSLDRIKNIPHEHQHKIANDLVSQDARRYLFFADYSIWCAAWAIACGVDENRGRVVFIDGRYDRFVSDSFSQFIEASIWDWRSIAYG